MKKLLLLCSLLAISLEVSFGQTTALSATVVDSDSTTWANGTWSIAWTPGSASPNISAYTVNGTPLSQSVAFQNGTLNGSGALAVTVYDSSLTTPTGSGYALTLCSNTSAPCSVYNLQTAGASQNISAALTASITAPRFKAVSGAYGYADGEATVQIATGATYWNVTSSTSRCYTGSAWGVCSTGGGTYTGIAPIVVSGTIISCANATSSTPGCVQPDNSTITVSGGVISTSSSAPVGPAGGDLSGTYPNPNVAKVNGATVPLSAGCLGSNGSNQLIIGSGCATFLSSNLLARYLFTDGSGTTLTDSSGNANNCTLTAPAWKNALWLNFAGDGTDRHISCPTAVWTSANTVIVWMKPRNIATQSETVAILMGSDLANAPQIQTDGPHPGTFGIGIQTGYMGGNNGVYPQWADKWTGATSFGITLGSPASLYKLGRKEDVPVAAANLTAFTATSKFYVGCNAQTGSYCNSFAYTGDIYAMEFFSTALTQIQMANEESAMESYLLANKGISFKENVNYDANPIVLLGDSILDSGAPTGSTVTSATPMGVISSFFPALNFWTLAIAGDTASNMATRVTTQAQPLIQRFQGAAPSVVLMQGGTNDIFTNATAAAIYANQKSICTSVHAVAAKCVVATIAAAARNSGPQETVRLALNALDLAGYLSGDLGADGIADIGDDPIIGNNLNNLNIGGGYYADNVHLGVTAIKQIFSPRIALGIQSATSVSSQPMTISMRVPRSDLVATSATTGSINLLQLGTNQKVCGVTIRPTASSKGGLIATATLSVGDTLGSATTYAPAYDVFQAAGATVFQDTTVLKSASYAGGVVTGTFTTTVGNVNAAFTDLVVDGTTNTKVTSASYTFLAADAGTDIYISAGTGWTVGSYRIISVTGGAATLGSSPAAVSTTGGSYIMGEVVVDLCVVNAP